MWLISDLIIEFFLDVFSATTSSIISRIFCFFIKIKSKIFKKLILNFPEHIHLSMSRSLLSIDNAYNVVDENGNILYHVIEEVEKKKHVIHVYNPDRTYKYATIKPLLTPSATFSFLSEPKNYVIEQDGAIAQKIKTKICCFRNKIYLPCKKWKISGDVLSHNYNAIDSNSDPIMTLSSSYSKNNCTYSMNIMNKQNMLLCVIIMLSISLAFSNRASKYIK